MGNFQRDIKRGKIGETIVLDYLKSTEPDINYQLAKGKFSDWDIFDAGSLNNAKTIEVKFDEKSAETGNICFESCNGKGEYTGIFASKAKRVFYVVPEETGYGIFIWDRLKLLAFIKANPKLFRYVNGGDGNKFGLLLIKKDDILGVGEYVQWDVNQD